MGFFCLCFLCVYFVVIVVVIFFSSDVLTVTYTELGALVGSDNEEEAMLPFKHVLKFSKSKNFPNIQKSF